MNIMEYVVKYNDDLKTKITVIKAKKKIDLIDHKSFQSQKYSAENIMK